MLDSRFLMPDTRYAIRYTRLVLSAVEGYEIVRTILASHEAMQDKPAALGRRIRGAGELDVMRKSHKQ
jgi:hypothetical protein